MKLIVDAKWFASGSMFFMLLSACGNQYPSQRQLSPISEKSFRPIESAPANPEIAEAKPVEEAPLAVTQETPVAAAPESTPPPPSPIAVAPAPDAPHFVQEKPQLNIFSSFALLRMPEFKKSWGLSPEIYERVVQYYTANRQFFKNPDYVTIVDFTKHSNEKRFFIFDLRKGRMISLLTTHGTNSDPLNLGVASNFSNTENSLQSSLGFFLTLDSYEGLNGYSLRLRGLEPTNSNAEKRGIVIHSAPYVNEELGRAGRSWGCLALDPKVSRSVINHLLGGSLLYIGK